MLNDYIQVIGIKPAGFAVLRFYGIKSIVMDQDEPLVTVINALPEWQKVYSDTRSVIFIRKDAADQMRAAKTSKPTGQE